MAQATGQKILRKKEAKLNNFFILDSGILLDFEDLKPDILVINDFAAKK